MEDRYKGQNIPKAKPDRDFKGSFGPGCFGKGPGKLSTKSGMISFNTMSFIIYGRIYEIMLVLTKDTRRSKVVIELDLGQIPEPIMEVKCLTQDMCFPGTNGVWVNPTARLAVIGNCKDNCGSGVTYEWTLTGPGNITLNTVIQNIDCHPCAV